ncbi:Pentatricopeptide repeat-containing protein [Vitis vinifera]|uniref:Pentatricopeptide repeat-containing protein n=1 Tax=Vitis vinifera TaxID=29760 RepID=A0A438KPS1_VITVI|nr:Pentatricopeptide repeat-containing protein [Vitis vinifera]
MQKKEEKEKILPFLNGLEIVGASDLSSESSPRWHVLTTSTPISNPLILKWVIPKTQIKSIQITDSRILVIKTAQSVKEEEDLDLYAWKAIEKTGSKTGTALQESGVAVRSGLTERVLNRCGDAGNLGYRFFVWASKQPGYRHSYEVYKAMIKILGKMRQFGAVWALIEEMRRENPQLYRPMSGKMVDAYDLLKEMRRKECEPNVMSFTTLIQALCAKKKMEEAMRVFFEMQSCGCPADAVTYTTLITHEKKEELEECIELMEEMRKIGCTPDLNIYNIVIRLACKLGEIKEGVRVWNEMEATGLSPGLDTFVIMIHGFLSQRCLVEACEFFKEMVGRGLLSAPQYGTLKELLNSLLRAEKLEMSKDVWSCIMTKDVISMWVMPQPDTFAKLMRGLRKLYNRQIAAEITEKVRKMAAEREMTFKMYKRRGERNLKEKIKEAKDGRKRRARRRRWGGGMVELTFCSLNGRDSVK